GSLSGGDGRSARSFGALALDGSIGVGPACRLFLATRSLSLLLVIGAARLLGGELLLGLLQSLPTRFPVRLPFARLANDLALRLCALLRFSGLLWRDFRWRRHGDRRRGDRRRNLRVDWRVLNWPAQTCQQLLMCAVRLVQPFGEPLDQALAAARRALNW